MQRINIYLGNGNYKRLQYYIKKTYGKHKALSMIIDQAVEQFLVPHFNCEKCGKPYNQARGKNCLVLHHITPIADGGTDEPDNIMVLCKACHSKIHDIPKIMRGVKNRKE